MDTTNKTQGNKHTQGQMTDYKERLRKISDPVKKAEESCCIASRGLPALFAYFEKEHPIDSQDWGKLYELQCQLNNI